MEFEHPYQKEIEDFMPDEKFLEIDENSEQPAIETEKNYLFVDNMSNLKKMMKHLKTVDEIAIDLEHHSYRSFLGFTCLIQVNTKLWKSTILTFIDFDKRARLHH